MRYESEGWGIQKEGGEERGRELGEGERGRSILGISHHFLKWGAGKENLLLFFLVQENLL